MKYPAIPEEELKNCVAKDYFAGYDTARIIGKIDFSVAAKVAIKQGITHHSNHYFLWAEAKRGNSADIYKSLVQLILTIGKARTFDQELPPTYLGSFDAEKIAFIPYDHVSQIFYLNDFNWNVAPSELKTKEFSLILEKVRESLEKNFLLFYFGRNDAELKEFIRKNFVSRTLGQGNTRKIRIDKNNFMVIYSKWLERVKPSIAVDWEVAKQGGIIDGDFYLADLLARENETLKDKLNVLLRIDRYRLSREIDEAGMFSYKETTFTDGQQAHHQFWNIYERPPQEEYWDYIIDRRDLLVPQDVRERKGSFYTPKVWVEKSQEYLVAVLGADWQDEYYVWDCAAGTGNLLASLTNKYRIWASTLDQADVDVMHDRIENGANLLEKHTFQFDFLNDSFDKLPDSLKSIINDPEQRKKLVIYINPPYAEASTTTTVTGTGTNKAGVSISHAANKKYKPKIGNASNEIFALFMAKVYDKLAGIKLALFSKLKFVQGTNFLQFREYFQAKYLSGFIAPAATFDNVRGKFPIGFTVWDLSQRATIKEIDTNIFDEHGRELGSKKFYGNLPESINKWIKNFHDRKIKNYNLISLLVSCPPDFQHNSQLAILSKQQERYCFFIDKHKLIPLSIYFAVRHAIPATWINDRDQFLTPRDGWQSDTQFQSDCLAYTLFHGQNRITSQEVANEGTNEHTNRENHWIPFTELEVGAGERFASSFMTDFIRGQAQPDPKQDQDQEAFAEPERTTPLAFSPQAQAVFSAGRELWSYYHQETKSNMDYNVNASLYDIREHFQGRNAKGKMNHKSDDAQYNQLIKKLRQELEALAQKIEPKV